MIRKSQIAGCLILAALFFAATPMRSEGPLYVGGPSDAMGVPYAWSSASLAFDNSTKTLSFWTDQGPLGSISNSQANTLVSTALGKWSGVSTANIQFSQAGQLGADVTSSNAQSVIDSIEACGTLPNDPSGGIAKPVSIIYDTNGTIISLLGGDPNSTLGVAIAECPTSDGVHNTYNRGWAVLNGKFSSDTAELTTVMIHEFGHMLGLDHSQINLDCMASTGAPNPACISDGSIAGVPIMFPVLVDNKQAPVIDDIAGISALYPVTGTSPPAGKTLFNTLGEIRGKVFFTDGVTQAQGFNVIARNVLDPRVKAVSNLSGYLFTEVVGNSAIPSSLNPPIADPYFSRNQTVIGFFDIPGLPPGDYTIEVEAVNNSGVFPFVYGSSIGPIGSILGFQFALPGSCTSRQFYDTTIGTDPCTSANATTVNVPAASTLVKTGVDISLIGTGQRYDAWEDGP